MDTLRVKLERLDPSIVREKTCAICHRTENTELSYGKLHTVEDITAHYFCLLFTSNLEQKGSDNEGIFGFMAPEINREIEKSQKSICSYCGKSGATIICVQRMCKKVFHLPCGMMNESLHHYFGRFQSFCKTHRKSITVPASQLMIPEAPECPICFELLKRDRYCRNILWVPCCKVNSWVHKLCIQKLALSSGYFFKCPRCNNKDIFLSAMRKYGVYIPEKDASWELEPNAFEELLHRHDRCDSEICVCPAGREYDKDDTDWEVILCDACGSHGVHVGCLPYKNYARKWFCKICAPITKNTGAANGAAPISSSSSTSAPVECPGSSGHPERKRSAQWVDSNQITFKCARVQSMSSAEDEAEGVPGSEEDLISTDGEEDSSHIEVVDVEEDQKIPDQLVTKDGVAIKVISFNGPIPDNSNKIDGDIVWDVKKKDIEEIDISDSEESVTNLSDNNSNCDTICLD